MTTKSREAILVSIGDELLTGKVLNTNLQFLGRTLLDIGIKLTREITVPDNLNEIIKVLKSAVGEFPLVIITGGLGLTHDDLTRKAISVAFNLPLERREDLIGNIKAKIEHLGGTFKKMHEDYLLVPEGFEPIENERGIAPGLWGKQGDTYIAALPGPPREVRAVFEKLLPELKKLGSGRILYKVIKTFGLKEIEVSEILKPYINELMPMGLYPTQSGVEIRIEVSGRDEETLSEILRRKATKIRELLGENVYGEDGDTLEGVFGELLKELGLTVATAESCTGGLVANLITDVSGSSNYMIGSVVAYHNRIKEQLLDVPKPILEKHGAVSEPVARLMADGIRRLFNVDIGLSTTGIAGPTGGTPEKPVGLVYMLSLIHI